MPTPPSLLDATRPNPLIAEDKLQARLSELASEINQDYHRLYHQKAVTVIAVLKGSFIFFADLIRQLDFPLTCEFLGVHPYARLAHSGEVKITLDVTEPLENRHVLVVEDLVSSGLTLSYIVSTLKARQPASIQTVALLQRAEGLKSDLKIDYLGFKINSEFVVGYGLDWQGKMRGLPYIGTIENEH